MILILGSANIDHDNFDEALAVSQAHVLRSRAEPGCIEHGVSVSVESPNRLIFLERWANLTSLKAHFALPASRKFAVEIAKLSNSSPQMTLYESTEVRAIDPAR